MDSSSFELTLRPCKVYVPKVWLNFLSHLSKIHDLPERLAVVRSLKLDVEQEAARLAAYQTESFTMSMAALKNVIKALEEEEEVIIEGMKIQTPIMYVHMSKDTEDEEEGTLQGRRSDDGSHHEKKAKGISALEEGCRDEGIASPNSSSLYLLCQQKLASGDKDMLPIDPYIQYTEMQSRRAEPSMDDILFGGHSYAGESLQNMEVNLHKRKQASEELSQAPFSPSVGSMSTKPTLPPALSSLGSLDGDLNQVPSFSSSSGTMFTRTVPQVVSDDGMRVLENLQQPSSETMLTSPVPCVALEKGKQVVDGPRPRLLFRSSKGESSRPGNHSGHVVAPAPAPATAPLPSPAAVDKGDHALEEAIWASFRHAYGTKTSHSGGL